MRTATQHGKDGSSPTSFAKLKVPRKLTETPFLDMLETDYGGQLKKLERHLLARQMQDRGAVKAKLAYFGGQNQRWLNAVRGRPTATFFGSARDSAIVPIILEFAVQLAQKWVPLGIDCRTGAGPGYMNLYAKEWHTRGGCSQGIPLLGENREGNPEPRSKFLSKGFVSPPQARFGTRTAMMLVREVIAAFYNPGGFGTMDELYAGQGYLLARQMRTFNQTVLTGKPAEAIPPAILLDVRIGRRWFWDWVLSQMETMLDAGTISARDTMDIHLVRFGQPESTPTVGNIQVVYAPSVAQAVDYVHGLAERSYRGLRDWYQNYKPE